MPSTDLFSKSARPSEREALDTILTEAIPCAREFSWSSALAASFAEILERLRAGRFHLAVLGQFKRGKSSLLNALLGGDFLPSSVLPLTSLPIFIEYGVTTQVEVCHSNQRKEIIALDELAEFVTEEKNPGNEKSVSEVRIRLPSNFLQENFVLIDTPGIGSTFLHNNETTHRLIPKCDAAIFLLSVDPPVSEAELRFLTKVREEVECLLFAMNKIDCTSPDDTRKITAFFQTVLCKKWSLPEAPPIFPVSAKLGLEARRGNAAELWESSGMDALEGEVRQIARRMKGGALSSILAGKSLLLMEEWSRRVSVALSALSMPLVDLQNRLVRLEGYFEQMDAQRRDAFDILHADIMRSLERVEVTTREIKERSAADLSAWLEKEGFSIAESDEQAFRKAVADKLRALFSDYSQTFFSGLSGSIEQVLGRHEANLMAFLEKIKSDTSHELSLPPSALKKGVLIEVEKMDICWDTMLWSDVILLPSAATLEKLLPRRMRRRRLEKRLHLELDQLAVRNAENIRWKSIQEVETVHRRFREAFEARYGLLKTGTVDLVRSLKAKRGREEGETEGLKSRIIQIEESIVKWKEALLEAKRRVGTYEREQGNSY